VSDAANPIRLGVAGLGRAFTLMLPTFLADPRVQLVAACDPREEARAQFTTDFGGGVYEDIHALVKDPKVEAVYVASPHQFHAAHTEATARQGKHVLLEKPMALSLAECDQMIAQCQAAKVQLIVGHCHSFDAPYLHTRELIHSGAFGQVRMIHALNYTDFLYRPRRPEELQTASGGGVVFSQAAHQVDVVRLLASSRVVRVRAATGAWDAARNTEGAYAVLLWFENGAFASLTYSGYGHFDSDEWCDWIGEMGHAKNPADYGAARKRLAQVSDPAAEARLKNAATYGGPAYQPPARGASAVHQHFGSLLVSCERADLRPAADGVWIYADGDKRHEPLTAPAVPRFEVIDELFGALRYGAPPLHDGAWARATLEVCLALLRSAREQRDVELREVAIARAGPAR
jgi:phthalate 4,5-cis-dihydrodiol dehydrogenase